MPIFVKNDTSELYIEPGRVVFPRGKRPSVATCRRLRDVLMLMLAGLGIDSAEIARIMAPVTGRRIRQVLPRGDISTETMLLGIRTEIVKARRRQLRDSANKRGK